MTVESPELPAALATAARIRIPSNALPELLALLEDDDPQLDAIGRVIRNDPTLAARVLQAANSAAFGGRRTVTDIRSALVRIGQARVIRWALALTTESLDVELAHYRKTGQETAVLTALIAERLSERSGIGEPGALYSAGLLADIGKLALDAHMPEEVPADVETWVVYEEASAGVDHAGVGARMIESWGLPTALADMVRFHHRPEAADAPPEAVLVCLAQSLADGLHPSGIDALRNPAPCEAVSGLSAAEIETIALEAFLADRAYQESVA